MAEVKREWKRIHGSDFTGDERKLNRNSALHISVYKNDAIGELMRGSVRSTEGYCVTYKLARNQRFPESFETAKISHPEWFNEDGTGKFVLCVPLKNNRKKYVYDGAIKPGCILAV